MQYIASPKALDMNATYLGSQFVKTMDVKQRFLSGDKEAVMYQDPKAPLISSNQVNIKGLQVGGNHRAEILDHQHTSYVGQMIPDPAQMGKLQAPFHLSLTSTFCFSPKPRPRTVSTLLRRIVKASLSGWAQLRAVSLPTWAPRETRMCCHTTNVAEAKRQANSSSRTDSSKNGDYSPPTNPTEKH